MRVAWLAGLLVLCVVASGLILRGGGEGRVPKTGFASPLADPAQAVDDAAGDEAADAAQAAEAPKPPATFYRYTDETGTVRFVSSLGQVPKALRGGAQKVADNRVQRAPMLPSSGQRKKTTGTLALDATHEVVVYTAPWCGWCRKTLTFLTQHNVDFENRDIEADEEYREELLEKTGGTSIPVVEIDGQLIRGYDPQRMAQLLRSS